MLPGKRNLAKIKDAEKYILAAVNQGNKRNTPGTNFC